MNMRKVLFLFCIIGLLAIDTPPVIACECMLPPTAWVELHQADAVFIGRVVHIKRFEDPLAADPYSAVMEVKLKVRKGLKGVQSKEVVVRSASRGCGSFVFEKGREYLGSVDIVSGAR
jgi:hypothetical protein